MDKQMTYKFLREEIIDKMKKQDTYINFIITFMVTVWTIAYEFKIELILFFYIFMLLPFSIRLYECRYSIALISSYMSIVLETGNKYSWETMYNKYQKEKKDTLLNKILLFFSRTFIPITCLVSSIMFWWIRDFQIRIFNNMILGHILIIIQIIIILLHLIICAKYRNLNNMKDNCNNIWEKVLNNECLGDIKSEKL